MLPNTMLTRISTFVNNCRVCYDRWDDIVRNQSDPRFSNIEVSTLSDIDDVINPSKMSDMPQNFLSDSNVSR